MKSLFYQLINYLHMGAPCIFHLTTGYYCPGCGGTRSVKAMLAGHLFQSLVYHPLPLYVIVAVMVNLIQKIYKKDNYQFSLLWIWLTLAVVLVNFVVKNVALLMGTDLLI